MTLLNEKFVNEAMAEALDLAREAAAAGETPVGAVIVDGDGRVLGRGRNRREELSDPSAHAEILALREACRARGTWRLPDATVIVTLEPCVMCAGALADARVAGVVFGAWDARWGGAGSVHDILRDRVLGTSVPVRGGVREHESAALLREFFEARRPGAQDD